MTAAKVSVIMPVYNGQRYVGAAIDSVLAQSFSDFELIVINDGSTDASEAIICSYTDPRVRYIRNENNVGLANVRNIGINLVEGDYIAWLDCDDVSHPDRLSKQVALLEKCPDIGVCGTWVKTLGFAEEQIWRYPTDPNFLRSRMLFDDPLATSSVMMRTECVRAKGLKFDLNYPPAEDYELWERISREWKVTNIPEVLTEYRIHNAQTSVIKADKQRQSVWAIQRRLISQLGIEPDEVERELHLDIGVGWKFVGTRERVLSSERWLLQLERANREQGVFPTEAFKAVLGERWFAACRGATGLGFSAWAMFIRSPICEWYKAPFNLRLRLFLRSLLKWGS